MSKGYNNFMSKKAFHPGSFANQKRIHEAEAAAEAKRKHDEETLAQYLKEHELLQQKLLISKESKDKLSLNFMYEAPPGMKKPDEKQCDKIEWKEKDKPSTSTSIVSGISAKNQTKLTNAPNKGSGICLEWKRDKPAGRARPNLKSNIKKEVKIEKFDSTSDRKDLKPDVKRMKREV